MYKDEFEKLVNITASEAKELFKQGIELQRKDREEMIKKTIKDCNDQIIKSASNGDKSITLESYNPNYVEELEIIAKVFINKGFKTSLSASITPRFPSKLKISWESL